MGATRANRIFLLKAEGERTMAGLLPVLLKFSREGITCYSYASCIEYRRKILKENDR